MRGRRGLVTRAHTYRSLGKLSVMEPSVVSPKRRYPRKPASEYRNTTNVMAALSTPHGRPVRKCCGYRIEFSMGSTCENATGVNVGEPNVTVFRGGGGGGGGVVDKAYHRSLLILLRCRCFIVRSYYTYIIVIIIIFHIFFNQMLEITNVENYTGVSSWLFKNCLIYFFFLYFVFKNNYLGCGYQKLLIKLII